MVIRARFSLAEMVGHVGDLVATIREESAAKGLTVRWVIVDTLARAMAGMEENSAKDMGIAVAGIEAIAVALDCAVTAVHHSGKDQSRGERGSTAFRAAAEASIEVVSEGKGAEKVITATAGKIRDGEDGGTFVYRLAQMELGIDKWGRAVTSCTVEPLGGEEAAALRTKAKLRNLTLRQRDGLEALRDAAERYGRRITDWRLPEEPQGGPRSRMAGRIYRRVFIEDANPNTKKSAFQRVISDLTRLGHVAGYAGKFWTAAPEGADGANGANGANAPQLHRRGRRCMQVHPLIRVHKCTAHAAADLPDSEVRK